MSDDDHTLSERDEIEALLPWYAAGTLTPAEGARVEAALARDPQLEASYRRAIDELAAAVEDNQALGTPSLRAMDKLFAAIDAEPARRPALAPRLGAGVSRFFASLSPRTLAWASVAAALLIAVQAGVIGVGVVGGKPAAQYATASAPQGARAPGTYALVQFAPTATAAEIGKALRAHAAAIVDGPTPDGLYRVRLAQAELAPEKRSALAAALQDGKVVVFAAPAE